MLVVDRLSHCDWIVAEIRRRSDRIAQLVVRRSGQISGDSGDDGPDKRSGGPVRLDLAVKVDDPDFEGGHIVFHAEQNGPI